MARAKAEKEKIDAIGAELLRLTGEFCDEYLDEEYKQLAEKLILKMKRKRQVPFLYGRASTWAASIIYALGQINFLFDGSSEPHVAARDIPAYFGLSQSTVGQKAKKIRDMFGLRYWDPEFSTFPPLHFTPILFPAIIYPMKRAALTTILLLLLVGCSNTPATDPTVSAAVMVAPSPTSIPTPTEPPPSPGATAAAFLEAWDQRDFDAMYARLSPASRASVDHASFVQRYTESMGAASVVTVTTELVSALQQGNQAQVAFHLELNTALFGDLTADNTMSLTLYEGQWWVDWSPALIWPQLSWDHYFHTDYVIPVRANIYDRNGLGLAVAGKIVTVGVIPAQIQDEAAVNAAISLVTGMTPEEVVARYEGMPADWRIPIAEIPGEVSIDHNEMLSSIAGIYREEKDGRLYPGGGSAPHIVGWVSPIPAERLSEYRVLGYRGDEWVGTSGVEAWGERILAGEHGGKLTIIDASGNVLMELAEREAVPARPIFTTLDREFQQKVQQIIGGRQGAIVVLDARTGAVRALASGPGFDANIFAGPSGAQQRSQILSDPRNPLFNRAVHGTYPCGSVFKIVTMSAAMEAAGMDPATTTFNCPGYWEGLGPSARKACWKTDGHGIITLEDGLTASCDVVFYSVGLALDGLDPAVLPEYARGFGFGVETGLEGVVEDPGLVPAPDWKANALGENWWVGDTINLSIGQGYLLVTPLQVARMIAAVGNGGTLYRPYVVERVAASELYPEQVMQPEVVGHLPVTPEHLAAIQEALLGVTTRSIGTAPHRFTGLTIPVAGKTGTAESGGPESIPHSWFAAYAPADDPEIAIAVIVERAGEGSTVAAPMTRQVVEAYYGLPITPLPPEAQEGYVAPTPEPAVD